MGTTSTNLLDNYAEHYQRINGTTTDVALDDGRRAYLDHNLGPLLAGVPRGGRILDLGCGTGMLLEWLAGRPGIVPIGVDASSSQIELARRRLPEVEIVLADGLAYLQAHPASFDGIFGLDILEHLPETDLCIAWVQAIHAALVPGGFLYCRSPNAASLTGTYGRYIDLTHERIFTSTSMLQLLHAGGFADARILPLRGVTREAQLRLSVEHLAHRLVFRLCGRGLERVFTTNVCGLARKPRDA